MVITTASNLLAIWLSALLATQFQDDNGNNMFLGVIIIIIAIALFVVFWQWWRTVEEEDTAVDLRMTNAHAEPTMETAVASEAHHAHEEEHGEALELEHAEAEHPEAETAIAAEPKAEPENTPEPEAEPEPETVAPEEPITPDDLTKIEGVGPKISQLLQAAGFATFAQLAKAEINQLEQILEAAGSRYRLADPTTWPQQAGLAAAGQWEDLEALQENLKGGRTAE